MGHSNVHFALLALEVLTTILGMDITISTVYLVSTIVGVLPLVALGIESAAAHLFVLHYAALYAIMLPIGLASYTAAIIAGEGMMSAG